jgi:hypothetical protein
LALREAALLLAPKEATMPEQSVVGVYDTMAKAEEAVHQLDREGFPIQQVSIIGKDPEREKKVEGYVTVEDVAKKGMSTGALALGVFGLLSAAVSVWIPGFGHLSVAGPLATALLGLLGGIEGAVAGAAWGGVLGGLMGWAVSRQHLLKYEEHLRAGKYLVIAHGSVEEVVRAQHILHHRGAEELNLHVQPHPSQDELSHGDRKDRASTMDHEDQMHS